MLTEYMLKELFFFRKTAKTCCIFIRWIKEREKKKPNKDASCNKTKGKTTKEASYFV